MKKPNITKQLFVGWDTEDLQHHLKHNLDIIQIMVEELPKKFLANDRMYQKHQKIVSLISEVLNERGVA